MLVASVSVRRTGTRSMSCSRRAATRRPRDLGGALVRIPVVLHESNAIPGRVTRLLGRFCSAVAVGLPRRERIRGSQAGVNGYTRAFQLPGGATLPTWALRRGPTVAVMASQAPLNWMVRAVPTLLEQPPSGAPHRRHRSRHRAVEHPLRGTPFSDEIPGLLQHADLAISRAGAGSLSELAVQNPQCAGAIPAGGRPASGGCRLRRFPWRCRDRASPRPQSTSAAEHRSTAPGARLGQAAAALDPLAQMREGTAALAERDAERQLAHCFRPWWTEAAAGPDDPAVVGAVCRPRNQDYRDP